MVARHRRAGVTGHGHVGHGRRFLPRRLLGGEHATLHHQRSPDEGDPDGDGHQQPEAAVEPSCGAH